MTEDAVFAMMLYKSYNTPFRTRAMQHFHHVILRRLLLLAASVPFLVNAGDLYVSHSGRYDGKEAYTDHQTAIDAAQGRDTIWVEDGFLCSTGVHSDRESGLSRIRIAKWITLRSRSGDLRNPAIIRGAWHDPAGGVALGEKAVRCLQVDDTRVKVIGFRLENGATQVQEKSQEMSIYCGGGINGSCIVSNCFITGNQAGYGGGVAGNQLVLCDSIVSNNYARYSSGGIRSGRAFGSRIVDNRSDGDSGGFRWTYFRNCVIAGNHAKSAGGAGISTGQTLTDCIITNNVSETSGGGLSYLPIISDCLVGWNRCKGDGGGVCGPAYTARIIATNCTFIGNEAGGSGGGATCVTGVGCRFEGNFSGGTGGGAYNSHLTDCVVVDNVASNTTWLTGCGGGVANGEIHDSLIAGNRAVSSGEVNRYIGCGGGAYDMDLITGCVISNNTSYSRSGGAFSCILRDTLIVGNRSAATGGGISGDSIATNCSFIANSAVKGGGGASESTAVDCLFEKNYTEGNGGGAASSFLTNCIVTGNVASNNLWDTGNGGGISGGKVYHSLIAGNHARSEGAPHFGHGCGGGVNSANLVVDCVISNNTSHGRSGGVAGSTVYNSLIIKNHAHGDGGGCLRGTFYNTLFLYNEADAGTGGAAYEARLYNCTVYGNKGSERGGVGCQLLVNTVVWNNQGKYSDSVNVSSNSVGLCCTDDKGPDNRTTDPGMTAVGDDPFLPGPGSICKNRGLPQPWMVDRNDVRSFDRNGRRRVIGSTVDIGAYEAPRWGTALFIR